MANPLFRSLIVAFFPLIIVDSPSVCSGSGVGGSGSSSDIPFVVAQKKASLKRLKSPNASSSPSTSTVRDSRLRLTLALLMIVGLRTYLKLLLATFLNHGRDSMQAEFFHAHLSWRQKKRACAPAVITFRIPTRAALQVSYSTPIVPLDILAERPPEKKFEWAKRLLAKYGSLISVISIVVLFVYLVATPLKSAAKGSKRKR